ncbi:hypothetical protein DSUL_150017 [Desulfovibrionales bacterium]
MTRVVFLDDIVDWGAFRTICLEKKISFLRLFMEADMPVILL